MASSHPKVGSISQHAGKYTPDSRVVLETVPSLRKLEGLLGDEMLCCQHASHEILAAEENKVSDSDMTATPLAVHKNMDHPSKSGFSNVARRQIGHSH